MKSYLTSHITRFLLVFSLFCLFLVTTAPTNDLNAAYFSEQPLSDDDLAGANAASFETGSDFLISFMGPQGDPGFDAYAPSVAYNSQNQQYLVVWEGDSSINEKIEIWAQRVDALTGAEIVSDFQISFTGTPADTSRIAGNPDVAYNSTDNEFFVVWEAETAIDEECEIFGQRINGANGTLEGGVIGISVIGPNVDPDYDGYNPAVAYNSQDNEYAVVFEADTSDLGLGLVDDEFEIYAKRVTAAGVPTGVQTRISESGGNGAPDFDATRPDIAYNAGDNEYMIVWMADDNTGNLVNNEREIYAQRVSADLSTPGASDVRISVTGTDGDPQRNASTPKIAYNSTDNEFLVVFWGDGALLNDDLQVYGQRLSASCTEIGLDDFLINQQATGLLPRVRAFNPAVDWDSLHNQYVVAFQYGRPNIWEFEIWVQRLSGSEHDGGEIRVSQMGSDGDFAFNAQTPAISYSDQAIEQFLVVWSGDDAVDEELEIWGQRLVKPLKTFLPAVMRNP